MGPTSWPSVSVVIPVRNGAGVIGAAMRGVLDQDYPGDLELIVADGASTDGTRTEVHAVAEQDRRVRIVENDQAITPAGLNVAIRASEGEVIVRCDAQSVLPNGYIRRAVEILRETDADVVGGMQVAKGQGLFARAVAIAMTTPLGSGGARYRHSGTPGRVDTVYLGVFRRSALERVGLFDEAMIRNQDYELNHRVRSNGGVVYFHPDLRVDYTPRSTVGALFSQYRQYGEWKRRMLRRHPESLRARQLVPPLFVLGLVAALILLLTPWRTAAYVYLGGYVLALFATTLVELLRRRDGAALVAPIALAPIHVAWGSGFLLSDGIPPDPIVPELGPKEG